MIAVAAASAALRFWGLLVASGLAAAPVSLDGDGSLRRVRFAGSSGLVVAWFGLVSVSALDDDGATLVAAVGVVLAEAAVVAFDGFATGFDFLESAAVAFFFVFLP